MKVFIISSKKFYGNIPEIKEKLEKNNIEVFLPNCFDKPDTEEKIWAVVSARLDCCNKMP